MRRRDDLQKVYDHTLSDLIVLRVAGSSWSDSLVNYLLGQVVVLKAVLNPKMLWVEIRDDIIFHVDLTVENEQKKVNVVK